jgi:hypothetical protein
VLTVLMLFPDVDNAEFSETLFISNMAVNLNLNLPQVVVTKRVPGSLRVEFQVQPMRGSSALENVELLVDTLSTGDFVMDPLFGRWEVLRIVMPYEEETSSSEDNTITLVLIAGGAFVLMAGLVCGGMMCIRSSAARRRNVVCIEGVSPNGGLPESEVS